MDLRGVTVLGLVLGFAPAPVLSEVATSALVSTRTSLGGSYLVRVDLATGTSAPVVLEELEEGGGTRPRGRHLLDAARTADGGILGVDTDVPTDVFDPEQEFAPPALVRIDPESRLVTELVRVEPAGIDPSPGLGSPVRVSALAVESDTDVLVLHHDRSAVQPVVSLLRIDLVSGAATPVSTGGALCLASNLVLETPEAAILACPLLEDARVVRVLLETGQQEIVPTDDLLAVPTEVGLDPEGRILVGDLGAGSLVTEIAEGRIVRVAAVGAGILATGELLRAPTSLTPDEGRLVVGTMIPVDTGLGLSPQPVAGLVGVDTVTGEATLLYQDDFLIGPVIETVVLLPEASAALLHLAALAAARVLGRRAGG